MIDLVHQHLQDDESAPAREEAYFAGARLDDDEPDAVQMRVSRAKQDGKSR